MDAHYFKIHEEPFAVSDVHVRKLVEILTQRIGPCSLQAVCADGISRKFDNVKELAAYENALGKDIRRIRLSSTTEDEKKRATVEFDGAGWGSISLDIEGSEVVVSRLRDDVLEVISGTRVWYAQLFKERSMTVLFYVLMALFFGVIYARSPESQASTESFGMPRWPEMLKELGPTFVAFVVVFHSLQRRARWFPPASFLIGQGKSRFEHGENVRWVVIVGFLVSVVGGIVLLVL